MNLQLYQVDAFTHTPFAGNPAGVCITDGSLPDELMQKLAMEMNLSETAFVYPSGGAYGIRFFTPTVEIPLCGHATLASAHILYEQKMAPSEAEIRFSSKSGELLASGNNGWIALNFPAYPSVPAPIPERFKELTGVTPLEFYTSFNRWVVAVLPSAQAVAAVTPQFSELTGAGLGHLMVTAPGTGGVDYVMRCFATLSGIPEDPVTGSAECALAGLWHNKTGKYEFVTTQLSARGGVKRVRYLGDRVEILGQAVTVFNIAYTGG